MDDTNVYRTCMKRLKQRLDVVQWLHDSDPLGKDKSMLTSELACVQFRKILELIAFSSLTANKDIYAAAHANYQKHWKAKSMLGSVEKLNPAFYPKPLDPPVRNADGVLHFASPSDGYLTRDEFEHLYDATSEMLHMRNPFSPENVRTNIKYSNDVWVARIKRLLAWHAIRLVDSRVVWVAEIRPDGTVNMIQGAATPRKTKPVLGATPCGMDSP
jgi:hypothetical protein